MDDIEEVIRSLEEKYPIVPHTNAGRLFSTVRRMKAERELGLPVARRTGFAISVKDGKPANELNESAWESFYSRLCKRLAFSELKTPTSAKIVFHFDVHPSSMEELQNESGPNIENQG